MGRQNNTLIRFPPNEMRKIELEKDLYIPVANTLVLIRNTLISLRVRKIVENAQS